MNTNENLKLYDVIRSSMEGGKPHARYVKTVLGKLAVRIIDQTTASPIEIILEGDPQNPMNIDTCLLTFWTPMELAYFEKMNKIHLLDGSIVPYTEDIKPIETPNVITDEEIKKILSEKFFSLKNRLDKFTSPIPVQRFLAIAEEMNKPIGTINTIKSKLSELQAIEYEGEEKR